MWLTRGSRNPMEKSVSLIQSPNSTSHGVHCFVHFGSRTKHTQKCCAQSAFFLTWKSPSWIPLRLLYRCSSSSSREDKQTRLLLLLSVPSSWLSFAPSLPPIANTTCKYQLAWRIHRAPSLSPPPCPPPPPTQVSSHSTKILFPRPTRFTFRQCTWEVLWCY